MAESKERLQLIAAAQAGDLEARNRLILDNYGLMKQVITRTIKARIKPSGLYDQFIAVTTLGMIDAIRLYRLGSGFRFATYAYKVMQRRVIQARNRWLYERNQYTPAARKLTADPQWGLVGEAATDDDQGDALEAFEGYERLMKYINTLDDRTQAIIAGRMEGKTLEEIGDVVGVSRERVRQILDIAAGRCSATLGLKMPIGRRPNAGRKKSH